MGDAVAAAVLATLLLAGCGTVRAAGVFAVASAAFAAYAASGLAYGDAGTAAYDALFAALNAALWWRRRHVDERGRRRRGWAAPRA